MPKLMIQIRGKNRCNKWKGRHASNMAVEYIARPAATEISERDGLGSAACGGQSRPATTDWAPRLMKLLGVLWPR